MLESKCKKFFNATYDNTYFLVLKYINSKCKNKSDIEDIVQEVYCEFYKRIKRYGFSDIECVEAFLISICKKKLSDYFEKLKAQNISNFNDCLKNDDQTDQGTYPNTEENVFENMMLEKIWEEISTEGAEILEIFKLKFINDLTFEQISTKTGLSESTIKSKFYRTLQKIKNNHNEKG